MARGEKMAQKLLITADLRRTDNTSYVYTGIGTVKINFGFQSVVCFTCLLGCTVYIGKIPWGNIILCHLGKNMERGREKGGKC
jgi:hypothetical protein